MVNGPLDALVGVAAIAGVGDLVIPCQGRVRNGESMVAARMALHIGGQGHVAIGALAAGLVDVMV